MIKSLAIKVQRENIEKKEVEPEGNEASDA